MERNRSKHQIIFDILMIIRLNRNGIRYTPLLRQTNISSNSFSKYYEELLKKEFINEITDEKGKKNIYLSDKGKRYLEKYKIFIEILDEFDL